jgi:hypothetical protein
MKASKLTNSIYSILNEDKFSKYTLIQLYDELGEEGFVDYIEEICTKVIRGYPKFKGVVADIQLCSHSHLSTISFYPTSGRDEEFKIEWGMKNNTVWGFILKYSASKHTGSRVYSDYRMLERYSEVNIASLLKVAINAVYENVQDKIKIKK